MGQKFVCKAEVRFLFGKERECPVPLAYPRLGAAARWRFIYCHLSEAIEALPISDRGFVDSLQAAWAYAQAKREEALAEAGGEWVLPYSNETFNSSTT